MSDERESLWHELLAHPAWKELIVRLEDRQKIAGARLRAVARVSSDPLVAAVSHELDEIEAMMRLPQEELESERDSDRAAERAGR